MESGPYSLSTHPPIICPVPRAVRPDACSTFMSPSLFPEYYASSVIEPSTEISGHREIVEGLLAGAMSEINEDIESADGIYSAKMVDEPKRKERLKSKAKDKARELHSRLMERARKAATLARSASIKCPLFTSCTWVASPVSIAKGLTSDPSLYRSRLQMYSPSFSRSSSTRGLTIESSSNSKTVRLSGGDADHDARVIRMATAIANQCHRQGLREDIESLYEQLKNHTRAYLTTPDDPPPTQKTSISARLAAFYFSTLVPMDLMSKFPPAHSASIALDNAQRASQDMAKLSQIWNMFIGDAPGKWSLRLGSRMRLLREADFKKLCNLVEEGLRCWAFWTQFARRNEFKIEKDRDNEWRRDDVVRLACIDRFDASEIAKQLIVVGWKYIDLSTLRSTMEIMKSLGTMPSSAKDKEFQRTGLMRRWSMTATPPELKRRDSDEVVIEPFLSLRFSKDNPILVEINRKCSDNKNADILREVNEKLDAAISQRSVSPRAPISERKCSQLPRPLTIRKARPGLSASLLSEPNPQPIVASDGRILAASNIPRVAVRSIPPGSQNQRCALRRSNAVRMQNRRGIQDLLTCESTRPDCRHVSGGPMTAGSLEHSPVKVNSEASRTTANQAYETSAASARTGTPISKIPVVNGKNPLVDRP